MQHDGAGKGLDPDSGVCRTALMLQSCQHAARPRGSLQAYGYRTPTQPTCHCVSTMGGPQPGRHAALHAEAQAARCARCVRGTGRGMQGLAFFLYFTYKTRLIRVKYRKSADPCRHVCAAGRPHLSQVIQRSHLVLAAAGQVPACTFQYFFTLIS
jgi:hypothetical protein